MALSMSEEIHAYTHTICMCWHRMEELLWADARGYDQDSSASSDKVDLWKSLLSIFSEAKHIFSVHKGKPPKAVLEGNE